MSNKPSENRRHGSRYGYAVIAATLLLTSAVILKYWDNNNEQTPPTAVETPGQGDNVVLYSELNFVDSTKIEAPVAVTGTEGKIAAFTENLLSESGAVIKGTVINITFKDYKDNADAQPSRQSVIYEVKVDKIYFSNESFQVGDTIIVENDLYTYTSLAGSMEKLNTNRQYLLLLNNNEDELSIIYPFAPQIEITEDKKYVFPEHWVTLVNEKTKSVSMDIDDDFSYYGEMKLREDTEFEDDFQKLVDSYLK